MAKDKLHRIVSEFRKGILGKRPSADMCRAVCLPLQGYLSMAGYEAEFIEGEIDINNAVFDHVWLELPDGRIIDPTADQFSKPDGAPMPPVYIGEQPEWYLTV
jgi:hypothetical protein